MADATVRPARAGDVADIARIQRDTWRIGYAALLPADVLASLTPDRVEASWAAAVTAPPSPRHHVLAATEQDWVVGFAALGPADPADAEGAFSAEPTTPDSDAMGAVLVLLVEPRWGRRGHGSRLLAAAVDHLRADGFTHALAWVPEQDAASIGLYESAGWEPDGTARTLDADGHQVREIRLHTVLGSAPEPPRGQPM